MKHQILSGFVLSLLIACGGKAGGNNAQTPDPDLPGDQSPPTVWSTPLLISANAGVPDLEPGSNYAPQIATDSSGRAIAIWNQREAGIRAARYSPDSGWESSVSVMDAPVWNGNGDIAIDQMGNAIVVWSMPDGSSPGNSIFARRYDAVTGWEPSVLIEDAGGEAALLPQVAMDHKGNAIAVWGQKDPEGIGSPNVDINGNLVFRVFANRYEINQGWGIPVLLSPDRGSVGFPQVAMNQDGNAVVSWPNEYGILWTVRFQPDTGWTEATFSNQSVFPFTGGRLIVSSPHLAMASNGDVLMVWEQDLRLSDPDRHIRTTYASRYNNGVGWDSPLLIPQDNTGIFFPVTSGSGEINLVWSQHLSGEAGGAGTWHVYLNQSLVGGTWELSALLNSATEPISLANAYTPVMAMNEQGDGLLVYRKDPVDVHDTSGIAISKYSISGGWEVPQLISQRDPKADFPQVAIDPAGRALVVWRQDGGIWAAASQLR